MELEYTELYRCDICSKVFDDFKDFEDHFKSKHIEDNGEKIKELMVKLNELIVNYDKYFFSHESRNIFNKLMDFWGDDWEEYEDYCKENKLDNLMEGLSVVYDTYDKDEYKMSECRESIFKEKCKIFK